MNITKKLTDAAWKHKGTDLGGLLQWAALHIESQDEALAEARGDIEFMEGERRRLELGIAAATLAADAALQALRNAATVDPTETMSKDMAPHINLMGGMGDPDYLRSNGMTCRHVDLRETKPRKAKA